MTHGELLERMTPWEFDMWTAFDMGRQVRVQHERQKREVKR